MNNFIEQGYFLIKDPAVHQAVQDYQGAILYQTSVEEKISILKNEIDTIDTRFDTNFNQFLDLISNISGKNENLVTYNVKLVQSHDILYKGLLSVMRKKEMTEQLLGKKFKQNQKLKTKCYDIFMKNMDDLEKVYAEFMGGSKTNNPTFDILLNNNRNALDKGLEFIEENKNSIDKTCASVVEKFQVCDKIFEKVTNNMMLEKMDSLLAECEVKASICAQKRDSYLTSFDNAFNQHKNDISAIKSSMQNFMQEYSVAVEEVKSCYKEIEFIAQDMQKHFKGKAKEQLANTTLNSQKQAINAKSKADCDLVKEKLANAAKMKDSARINFNFDKLNCNERLHELEVATLSEK